MGALLIYYSSLGRKIFQSIFKWQSAGHDNTFKSARAGQFKTNLYFHLNLNFANCEYSVSQLSRDMGMSRSQLFRKCKLILRRSPVALIKQYRLEKSMELLKSGIYNVSEAAYLSGFNSLSYFSKSFKKLYGQMPSRWVA